MAQLNSTTDEVQDLLLLDRVGTGPSTYSGGPSGQFLYMKALGQRIAWYAGRLAAMGPEEIAHRFMEATKKQTGRHRVHDWEKVEPVGSLGEIQDVRRRILAGPLPLTEIIEREASKVRTGNFHLLGARWPRPPIMPPPSSFWHVDPIDGELFPQRDVYCFDISFRHGLDVREIKRHWEINRLQFVVPLAANAAIRNDRQSADLLVGIIRSWMDGNAPARGPNWIFGIELALRVLSVALALSIVGVKGLNDPDGIMVLKFFVEHVDWIRRFPSRFSSANNHRIAELAGLIVGSTMAPGIKDADALREDSWRELLIEIDRQIHPDGVGAEQSPGYVAFSIELFLVAAAALGRERTLPLGTVDRLAAWAEHSLWLMDADGRVPQIGDFDDCRVVATRQAPESKYAASIVAAISACLDRPDLTPAAKDPSIRDVLLGSAFCTAAATPTHRTGLRSFPIGGYSVIRSNQHKLVTFTFDHGPIGYLSIAAHGHADSLSIWLSVGDQPVLVDAGTYLYHSSKALRNAFRETAVHNTVTLDGRSSSRASGPFNWRRKAKSRLLTSENSPAPRVIAEHDGYLKQNGVWHRRSIEFNGIARFTVIDELVGASKSDSNVRASFLLDPACQVALESDGIGILVLVNSLPVARIVSVDRPRPRIARGDETSVSGWISPSFGLRVPTHQ